MLISSKDTVFYKLEKAIKLYRKMAQRRLQEAGSDLTINQLIVIIQLQKQPDLQMVDLADIIFKDLASVTRMIDLLFKKGYLERKENQRDRRRKDLVLTKAASEAIEQLSPVIAAYRAQAFNGFSEKEIQNLSMLLDQLSHNCQPYIVTE